MSGTIEEIFESRQMYDLTTEDLTPTEVRDFTVTVAGPERHTGESPYTYVVRAALKERAWATALAHHIHTKCVIDCYVIESQSFEGIPNEPQDATGCAWVDLRERYTKIEKLVDRAKSLNTEWEKERLEYVYEEDGEFRSGASVHEHDERKTDFALSAWETLNHLIEVI